jgi:hypothetical protein
MMTRASVPRQYLKLYDRAMSGKSMKAAIRAHCVMCMGWNHTDVPGCTAPGCPLFPYRLSKHQKRTANGPVSGAGPQGEPSKARTARQNETGAETAGTCGKGGMGHA